MSLNFTVKEKKILSSFNKNGFLIFKFGKRLNKVLKIRSFFEKNIKDILKKRNIKIDNSKDILNNFHKYIKFNDLNSIRLELYNKINKESWFLNDYFELGREELEIICGNELAMQRKVNLSIQLPRDDSSLLPVHSDVWSGCSPYEVVLWIPLVSVKKTKSMFVLPKKINKEYYNKFNKFSDSNSLQKSIDKKIKWLEIKFGEGLIFAHQIMHGNKINLTNETRWSFNCRFKSLMSPYDKKDIAETFFPIFIRPATKVGLEYEHPKV
jgi:sporadic carbohydrate cluster 2OG-Fe(II) oxygenase